MISLTCNFLPVLIQATRAAGSRVRETLKPRLRGNNRVCYLRTAGSSELDFLEDFLTVWVETFFSVWTRWPEVDDTFFFFYFFFSFREIYCRQIFGHEQRDDVNDFSSGPKPICWRGRTREQGPWKLFKWLKVLQHLSVCSGYFWIFFFIFTNLDKVWLGFGETPEQQQLSATPPAGKVNIRQSAMPSGVLVLGNHFRGYLK